MACQFANMACRYGLPIWLANMSYVILYTWSSKEAYENMINHMTKPCKNIFICSKARENCKP